MKHEHKQDKDGIAIRKEISGWALSLGLKTSHWDSSGIWKAGVQKVYIRRTLAALKNNFAK